MCSEGHLELLQHVSQKLTKEQMSILISQQSQVYRNTVCAHLRVMRLCLLTSLAAHHARCESLSSACCGFHAQHRQSCNSCFSLSSRCPRLPATSHRSQERLEPRHCLLAPIFRTKTSIYRGWCWYHAAGDCESAALPSFHREGTGSWVRSDLAIPP